MGLSFGILGPLQVLINGVDVTPPAPKERALLAMLVVNHGRVVGVDHLIDELWPALDPAGARRVLQVRMAATRKLLRGTSASVEFGGAGYRLSVAPQAVDAHCFFTLVERARTEAQAGEADLASTFLADALGLWRGDALADVRVSLSLDAEAARLDEARLAAIEDRFDADLACGRHHALVAELDALVAAHPLRERLCGQRIVALYRDGRQAEALRAGTAVRRQLADELGVDPGRALRALETAVLEQRADLDWQPHGARGRPVVAGLAPDEIPTVRYARTPDGINIAYQVAGEGPLDVILIPGYTSHLETWWSAWSGRFVRRLASFSRLILFDKRGMGLSDRPESVDIEHWVEDVKVLLDEVGSERAVILGVSAGCPVGVLFAATYPARTHALVLWGGFARVPWDDDYPIGLPRDFLDADVVAMEAAWGTGGAFARLCPSLAGDVEAQEHFARHERISASPGAATTYLQATLALDVRQVLPTVNSPTLVVHASRDQLCDVEWSRYLVKRMPDATLVEVNSADHLIWFSDALDTIANEIQDFITGAAPTSEVNRVLATVLVVDVIGDDLQAAPIDDVIATVERFRGTCVRREARGILVTFDGPARAIRCAIAVLDRLDSHGRRGRAGLHCGECEMKGDEVGGVAVDIARGVASAANAGEVVASGTVRDLVFGSSITFTGPLSRHFDGVAGDWQVYVVGAT